ncbi:carbohydrate-selective porin OprB [Methylobacterium sp. ME121]|nr:carbohydrate-selective porin OprB [Methylobacterium sp. ME121]
MHRAAVSRSDTFSIRHLSPSLTHVMAGLREGGDHSTLRKGQLVEAEPQHEAGLAGLLVVGFKQVLAQAVHALDESRTDTGMEAASSGIRSVMHHTFDCVPVRDNLH